MQRKLLPLMTPVVGLLLIGGVVAVAVSRGEIGWDLIGSGGGSRVAGGFSVEDSLGQAVVGSSQASGIVLEAGYWAGKWDLEPAVTPSATQETSTLTPTGSSTPVTETPTSTSTAATETPTETPTDTASPTLTAETFTPTPTSSGEPGATVTPTGTPKPAPYKLALPLVLRGKG